MFRRGEKYHCDGCGAAEDEYCPDWCLFDLDGDYDCYDFDGARQ